MKTNPDFLVKLTKIKLNIVYFTYLKYTVHALTFELYLYILMTSLASVFLHW